MEKTMQSQIELGKTYFEQKKYDLAIEQFQSAIKTGDKNEHAHFELGKIYYILNKHLLSIKELEESIRINPNNSYAYLFLAKAYKAQGKNEFAIQKLKKASEVGGENEEIHLELASLFKEEGIYNPAIKEYEQALKNNPNNQSLLDLLQLYNFQGEYDKVQKWACPLLKNHFWQEPFLKNSLLSELEISQRKLILDCKPRILLITLTNRCNLNCYMCGRGDSIWEISPTIIDQIISLFPFLELITWQGGEVFLADNFTKLFKKTFGFKELKQIIITNALLITEEWADRLTSRNNVGLTISIDSVDKEIYEKIRRGGSFEKLIQNLEIINKARRRYLSNMTTTLRCTIMKANYKQLDRFIEFAKDYEFDVVQMAPLSSDEYDPQNIFINKDIEILRYITQVIPGIRELAKKYKIKLLDWIPTLNDSNNHIEKTEVASGEDKSTERKKPVCFRPWKQIAMNVRGDIFPECLCAEPIGDAFNNTLDDVWNNEKMQKYRKGLSENDFMDWCRSDCVSGTIPPEHLKFTFV